MLKIARALRYWFGLQPLMAAVALPFVLRHIWTSFEGANGQAAGGQSPAGLWVAIAIALVVESAYFGVFAMAWFGLRNGRRTARGWAVAASVISLPVLGLGTVAGILGLVVFTRKDVVAQMAAPSAEAPRIEGDGTSKLVDQMATGAQIAVFIAASYFWNAWARRQALPEGQGTVTWFVQFGIALHLSVLAHEVGHVLGGWASHMKLRHLVIGPFEWIVRSGKWEFSLNASGLWGRGTTGMVPTRLKDLRGQRVFTTLGGPLGSLAIGCVGLIAALTAKGSSWEEWWGCCSMLATLGLSAFVYNLLPLRPEDQYSDGAHLYQLLSRGPWADVHMAFSVVSSTVVTPLRLRDLDLQLLRRAGAFLTSGKRGLLLRLFECIHHLDAERIPEALDAIKQAESLYPALAGTLEADLHADFVFMNALFRRDLEASRLWWQRMEAKGASKFKVDYWKARTAMMWLEGYPEAAEQAWQKGNAFAQQLPAAGAYEFDRWCYRKLREVLDAPETRSDVPPSLPTDIHQVSALQKGIQDGLMPHPTLA